MSMEELSRLAKNEGEDVALRRKAKQTLDERERKYFQRPTLAGLPAAPNNYVPGL